LTGKGIEPATLSIEQFNIFANQAPNLQTASLEMLAKYGAERLRIVHPDEKEQAGSSNSTPTEEQTTDASPATTSAPLSGSATSPVKKPRSKMKKSDEPVTEVSIGNGAVVPLEQDGELGTTESALKPKSNRVRKTRGQCDTCRQRQIKVRCFLGKPLSESKLNFLHSVPKSILTAPFALKPESDACTCLLSRGGSQKSRQKRWDRRILISQMRVMVSTMTQKMKDRYQCQTS
jgi:hypothetical protein